MSDVLLDTHAFVWIAIDDPRLGTAVAHLYSDVQHRFLLSVASLWEMAIKASLGRLELEVSIPQMVRKARSEQGIELLPISPAHAMEVRELPFHHRDPFDRLLAAQALLEGLTLATRDPVFEKYGVACVWGAR